MSISDRIIMEIDMLREEERQKVLDKIKVKYMSKDIILLSEEAWWDNEEDDIYNEQ